MSSVEQNHDDARLSAFLLSLGAQSSLDEQNAREHSIKAMQLLKETICGETVQEAS
jgi:hypothetical protein